MNKITYQTIMQAEVKANCYAGDQCDGIENYFNVYCEGDKQDSSDRDDLIIQCDQLPPGTRVTVNYPCCPECMEPRQDKFEHIDGGRLKVVGHESKCDCGFDWDEWVLNEYS